MTAPAPNLPNKPTGSEATRRAIDSLVESMRRVTGVTPAGTAPPPPTAATTPASTTSPMEVDPPTGAAGSRAAPVTLPRLPGLATLKAGVSVNFRDIAVRDRELAILIELVEQSLRRLTKDGERTYELLDDVRKETSRSFGSMFATIYEDFMRLDERVIPRIIKISDDVIALQGRDAELADRLKTDVDTAVNGVTNTLYPSLGALDHAIRDVGASVKELAVSVQDGTASLLGSISAPVYSPDAALKPLLEAVEAIRASSHEALALSLSTHVTLDSIRNDLVGAGIIGETSLRRSARLSASARRQSSPYRPTTRLRKTRAPVPAPGCKETANGPQNYDELDSTDDEPMLQTVRQSVAVGA